MLAVTSGFEDWGIWNEGHAVRLIFALGFLLLIGIIFKLFVSRILSRAITRAVGNRVEDVALLERRVGTLSNTLNWAFRIILVFIAAGLTLSEFGLNVSALIASVGVVGVALGLGAQLVVRDVINGIFILIEDQYAVGDTVSVAGITGEVVEINPRRTVIRDGDGNIHSIPNSTITIATNRTAGLNRFVVDVTVPFRESERAMQIVQKVCTELAAEHALVLAGPAPRIVDQRALAEGMVGLKVAGDARPPSRWAVEADLRRRLKRAFEAERLEMEFGGAEAAK
jgi:small conductance mechanosensitive channel